MPNAVMLAFTSPTSDDTDAAFNRWYNEKHLPEVAALPGVISATRYRIAHEVETLPGVGGPTQKYVAVYELDAETDAELGGFCETLRNALADGRANIDVTLDMADLGATLALPIGLRRLHDGSVSV